MKKNIIIIALLSICSYTLSAQTAKSVYFSEKNPLRHELNASFAPESGYVSIPMIGNIGISTKSNIQVSSFLYPQSSGSELNTFMSSDVDSDEFLNNIANNNKFSGSFSMDLLAGGFYKWGGFNNVSLKAKASFSTNMPYEMFEFLKLGMSDEAGNLYEFDDMSMTASAVTELALGHSREMLIPGLRLGAKVKFLFGVINADAQFNTLNASLSQDLWSITNNGYLNMSGLTPTYNSDGELDGIDGVSAGLNGFGMAFDLGASYEISKDFNVSFGVTDLGFMKWNNINSAVADQTFEFTGFEDIDIFGDLDESIDSQTDALESDLKALYSFVENKTGTGIKSCYSTSTSINIGGEYGIIDNMVSFGLLWTTQFDRNYTWTDVMASVNYRPASCVNIGINGSVSNMGSTYGAMINFCHKTFNMFIGANAMSLKVAAGDIPVPLNGLTYQASLGFSVMLAKNKAQ